MIAAHLSNEAGSTTERILFILEPVNIEKLKLGLPIIKRLDELLPGLPPLEILIGYTPDIIWVGQNLASGRDLRETILASLDRKEVFSRTLDPEALRRQEIAPMPPKGGR